MNRTLLLLAVLLISMHARAEDCPSGSFTILDAHQAIYPPIARAAHVMGNVRVFAMLTPEGTVSDAHSGGGPRMLEEAAAAFVRGWTIKLDPHLKQPCTADIEVKFAFIPEEAGTPSAQFRQSRLDSTHWLIETPPITTVDYAATNGRQPVRCLDLEVTHSDMPIFPPIALAANIDGSVSFELELDGMERVKDMKVLEGSEFFRASAEAYVKSFSFGWQSEKNHKNCTEMITVSYRRLPVSTSTSSFTFERVTEAGYSDTYVVARPPNITQFPAY